MTWRTQPDLQPADYCPEIRLRNNKYRFKYEIIHTEKSELLKCVVWEKQFLPSFGINWWFLYFKKKRRKKKAQETSQNLFKTPSSVCIFIALAFNTFSLQLQSNVFRPIESWWNCLDISRETNHVLIRICTEKWCAYVRCLNACLYNHRQLLSKHSVTGFLLS